LHPYSLSKNYKHKLKAHKSFAKHFCMKKLTVKCWWLWNLNLISPTFYDQLLRQYSLAKSCKHKMRAHKSFERHFCMKKCYREMLFNVKPHRRWVRVRSRESLSRTPPSSSCATRHRPSAETSWSKECDKLDRFDFKDVNFISQVKTMYFYILLLVYFTVVKTKNIISLTVSTLKMLLFLKLKRCSFT